MSKIYISARGGCILGVYSTNKKDKVELWDWDDIEADCEDTEDLEKEFEEITKKIHYIF